MTESLVYRVFHNRAARQEGRAPVVEGIRQWKLPSIRCSICRIVSGETAVIYPWIDLSGLPDPAIYKGNKVCVMGPEELALATQPIRAMLPADHPLPPGTSFGAYKGRHTAGRLEDFHLYEVERLLARSVYERLRGAGALSISATPACIKGRKGELVEYVELHLVPRAQLAVPMIQLPGEKWCRECGFDQRSLPERLVVRSDTIPLKEEIFQLVDRPYVKIAKEHFVETVKAFGLTGIEFEPVEVV